MSAVASPVLDTPRPMTSAQLDQLSINCIRTLSMDAVQQAKSGHPGTPMALAPLVYTLWNRVSASQWSRPRRSAGNVMSAGGPAASSV